MCFAPRGRESVVYLCCHSEGGKSDRNTGHLGFVRAVIWGVSYKIHWRLSKFHCCPRPLPTGPLSTTFVHILRLKHLLSIIKLQVTGWKNGLFLKARGVVAY